MDKAVNIEGMLQRGFLYPHHLMVHVLPAAAQNLPAQAVSSNVYLLILDTKAQLVHMIHQLAELHLLALCMMVRCNNCPANESCTYFLFHYE